MLPAPTLPDLLLEKLLSLNLWFGFNIAPCQDLFIAVQKNTHTHPAEPDAGLAGRQVGSCG